MKKVLLKLEIDPNGSSDPLAQGLYDQSGDQSGLIIKVAG